MNNQNFSTLVALNPIHYFISHLSCIADARKHFAFHPHIRAALPLCQFYVCFLHFFFLLLSSVRCLSIHPNNRIIVRHGAGVALCVWRGYRHCVCACEKSNFQHIASTPTNSPTMHLIYSKKTCLDAHQKQNSQMNKKNEIIKKK